MSPIVYLISGANRGIGFGFVTALSKKENVIIFAGARNPSGATDLQALVKKLPEKVHIVKLTSADKRDNEAAVAEIKKIAGRLDVVIANAGINQFFGTSLEALPNDFLNHYEVNVVGTLVLFQATYSFLKESTSIPKFVAISSLIGSITDGVNFPVGLLPYGASKAALNYMTRRWHFEFPELTVFSIHPGGVETDMSSTVLENAEELRAVKLITVEDAVNGLLKEMDNGTRESIGGQFVSYTGEKTNW